MSEEQENDGTWSGLKKTIIGTIATITAAGGAYFATQLFGGEESESTKTEQAAPVINLNVDNSSQNNSSNGGGGTTVIKEKTIVEKPAQSAQPAKEEKKSESEDAPW
jgi:hypothetical protein